MSLIRYTYTPIVPEYIRIIKCSERTFWYRGRVGKILKVRSLDGSDYIVEGPDTESIYFVSIKDCEPVEAKRND